MKKTDNKMKHHVSQATAPKGAVIEPGALPGDPPAYQEIAALAYSYWESRGYQGGSAEEDWFRAQEELRNRHAQMRTPKKSGAAAKAAGA